MFKKSLSHNLIIFSQILSFIVIILFFLTYEFNTFVKAVFSICIILNLVVLILVVKKKFKVFNIPYINYIIFLGSIIFSLIMLFMLVVSYMLTDKAN